MATPREDLATFTFLSKYARFRPADKRRETYDEAVDRMCDMHLVKYRGNGYVERSMGGIRQALKDKRILGSQRALQFGGDAILRKEIRGYNCSYSFFDRPRFLAEAVWNLLCGCGVGFSVQKHHVAKLPKLIGPYRPTYKTHVVGDSIEGWADAFDALFLPYIDNGASVRFDYSEVRPEGAPLSTSSAKAPGAKPLRDALEACRKILDAVVDAGGVIRPIDAYDLVMCAASCVRAGGIRRSATIALFSPNDEEMQQAKTGEWCKTHPNRRLSNNSVMLVRATASEEDFRRLIRSTQEFGEPGFSFNNSTEHGPNPCHEISMYPVIDDTTGWSFCNLTTVNAAACKTKAQFVDACYLAGVLGTIQAGYTDAGYLGDTTRRIMERDALLGVSLTGMADNPEVFSVDWLREGAAMVRDANEATARALGIAYGARLTCVKPEGTGSLVLGVGNGIHPHHSRRYLRYVEGAKASDPLIAFLRKVVPEAVVPSAYAEDEFKVVFPIDLGADADLWLKSETTALSHLEKVVSVQANWVLPGTVRGDLFHNVSNTIQVKPGEWQEVGDFIWKNRDLLGGVALLGQSGDLDYAQAPFVDVDGPEPERTAVRELWERLARAWPTIDWSTLTEEADATAGTEVVACAGGACSF